MDECKPLAYGRLHDKHSGGVRDLVMRMRGRGLHSSTFQLNLSRI